MSTYLTTELRRQLVAADDHRCAYCRTTQANSGQPMVLDHIIPESKGGETVFENLCFACRRCNEFKGPIVVVPDPLTNDVVPLFHPRQQIWEDHFAWDVSGLRLIGRTAVGRVSIIGLNMNNEIIVAARRRWVNVGWHPPR